MLDPRIYRTGLILGALALVVLGFSLRDQTGPLTPTLAPDAFNAQNALATMRSLQRRYGERPPGSAGDRRLAGAVAARLAAYGFHPQRASFTAATAEGSRTLEDVIGTSPGSRSGTIVIAAPRDAPGLAGISATAMLIELARDLQAETVNHSVALVSTSGSQGAAGAAALAAQLAGPVDAVVVLGDVAGTRLRQPIVVPWGSAETVASPQLRNTIAAALAGQGAPAVRWPGFGAQYAHLAFPFTLGLQGPLNAAGIPAVGLSVDSDALPAPAEPINAATVQDLGRGLFETVSALDRGGPVAAPGPYLLLSGKVLPTWPVALLGLALLIPIALTTVDGIARARRRGHVIWPSLALVLAAGGVFLIAALVVAIGGLAGAFPAAPPGPVAPGRIPLTGGAAAVLGVAALALLAAVGGWLLLARRLGARMIRTRSRAARRGHGREGSVAALMVVAWVVTALIWAGNPYAGLLLVPALHLWLWALVPDLPLRRWARLALVLAGAIPSVLVVAYYVAAVGYSPAQAAWQAVLLIAGHGFGVGQLVEWSLALGCLAAAVVLALLPRRDASAGAAAAPSARRGPALAGAASRGVTYSALRR